MLRVWIADDELLARRRLHRLLAEIPDVVVVGESETGAATLARVRAGGLDVVLLDVSMPSGGDEHALDGVEVMRLWPRELPGSGPPPMILFVTAHAEHAVDAFDGGAVDYLLKPVAPDKLQRALDRARARLRPSPVGGSLAFETRAGVVLVRPAQVVAVVLDGVSVVAHTDLGPLFTTRTLADLENMSGGALVRVHRSALLNLDRVRRFEPQDGGGYLAWTDLDLTVPVSRQSARELRRLWGIRHANTPPR